MFASTLFPSVELEAKKFRNFHVFIHNIKHVINRFEMIKQDEYFKNSVFQPLTSQNSKSSSPDGSEHSTILPIHFTKYTEFFNGLKKLISHRRLT